MNYIDKIRKIIGHDELISVACGVVIENEKGEILLQKRSDTKDFGLPGGAIEIGEKVINAAKREVFEETNLIIDELKLLGIHSGEDTIIKYPNGDVTFYVIIVFYTRISDYSNLKWNEESEFLKFYAKDKLPNDIKNPDINWINKWKNNDFTITIE